VEVAVRSLRLLFVVVLLCYFSLADDKPALTFVQITDAHVFDDGWNQPVDTGYKSVGDDWSSFHWAIQQINEMVRSGEHIDFVVYTGDFGLSNVELHKDCLVVPTKVDPKGLPPIRNEWAVRKLASELNTLAVNTVYFVAGNNDLSREAVTDAGRPKCFVKLVEYELESLTPASAVHFSTLRSTSAVSLNGFRLVGFNSASFKDDTNYKDDCPLAGDGCPDVEIASLQTMVSASSSEPILLFTHIPDLVDPYRKRPNWKINDEVRKEWKAAACDKEIAGIFAGHFHDSGRNLYGTTTGTASLVVPGSECVAKKTWVTPPLSIKNQIGKSPTARGLSVVRIFKDGQVKADVRWY